MYFHPMCYNFQVVQCTDWTSVIGEKSTHFLWHYLNFSNLLPLKRWIPTLSRVRCETKFNLIHFPVANLHFWLLGIFVWDGCHRNGNMYSSRNVALHRCWCAVLADRFIQDNSVIVYKVCSFVKMFLFLHFLTAQRTLIYWYTGRWILLGDYCFITGQFRKHALVWDTPVPLWLFYCLWGFGFLMSARG